MRPDDSVHGSEPIAPRSVRTVKPYSTPVLTTYGPVTEITKGAGRVSQDGNSMRGGAPVGG